MADVVLFGVGQIADVAKAYLDWEGTHRVVAYTVDESYIKEPRKEGLPVTAWERLEADYPPSQVSLFCPLSYRRMNEIRKERFLGGRARGYGFITFIHPRAHYYGTPVGENCFILEANVIQPHTEIGDNCVLWSGNHIGHHSRIGSHTFIASHVVISGNVVIGERCFFGVNATLGDNLRVGDACLVGAGALVTHDVPDAAVVPGAKSKPSSVKSHQLKGV